MKQNNSTIPGQAVEELYDYLPYARRPKFEWPEQAHVAVCLIPNIEIFELVPPKNPTYQGWNGPAPDMLFYTRRDYGNRSGMKRMMEVLDNYNIRASVSLNVAICDHYPEIIEECVKRDWELFSHGVYNTRYFYNLSIEQQREVIGDVADTIKRASGQKLSGWLTPAITPTLETARALAEMGLEYTCDMCPDEQPLPLKVPGRLVSIPYALETNDYIAFMSRGFSPADYTRMLIDHFDCLYEEGRNSGTVMTIPLHPFLIGQPHRIGALDAVLKHIAGHSKVWFCTAREIARHYEKTAYDSFAAAGGAE